jgi:IclR family transcriptional regulator, KDG regulon repressor
MDKTLLKGLSVLEALARMDVAPRSVDDVADQVGLSRSNAHRTLQTLIHAGFVEHDAMTGAYRTSMKLFSLGVRQLGQLDVRRAATRHIAELARESGETVHLSVLDGVDVIYIDKIDSVQPIRAYSMVGGRAPAHAVATGKALLAAGGEECVARLGRPLARYTPATIVDPAALKAELARAARLGYAMNRGEWRDGVGGVAAPVFNGFARPVAAIGISGPLDRLTLARMKAMAPAVMDSAAALSRELGYAVDRVAATV